MQFVHYVQFNLFVYGVRDTAGTLLDHCGLIIDQNRKVNKLSKHCVSTGVVDHFGTPQDAQ